MCRPQLLAVLIVGAHRNDPNMLSERTPPGPCFNERRGVVRWPARPAPVEPAGPKHALLRLAVKGQVRGQLIRACSGRFGSDKLSPHLMPHFGIQNLAVDYFTMSRIIHVILDIRRISSQLMRVCGPNTGTPSAHYPGHRQLHSTA
jgi:hypothetical protein